MASDFLAELADREAVATEVLRLRSEGFYHDACATERKLYRDLLDDIVDAHSGLPLLRKLGIVRLVRKLLG